MKLSEAIRLGAMLHPQAFEIMATNGRTCAMGAACEASGIALSEMDDRWIQPDRVNTLIHQWNQSVPMRGVACPECRRQECGDTVCYLIAHLNDYHHWSREQIADWVATVEPSETTDGAIQPDDVRGTTEMGEPVLATRA